MVPARLGAADRTALHRLGWSTWHDTRRTGESLLGRALARTLVAGWAGCPADAVTITITGTGRPLAVIGGRPGPAFSLTHDGGHVAVAVAPPGSRIGIDLDLASTVDERVLERVFAAEDVTRVRTSPAAERPIRFARLWTAAEACLKATGAGVTGLLSRLPALGPGPQGGWPGGDLRWRTADSPARGVLALAGSAALDLTAVVDVVSVRLDGWSGAPAGSTSTTPHDGSSYFSQN
jgi:4'-phosphopantetheinyl transferase